MPRDSVGRGLDPAVSKERGCMKGGSKPPPYDFLDVRGKTKIFTQNYSNSIGKSRMAWYTIFILLQ